ncbi:hypothetical protein SAMN05216436_11756 [bacterium A37T11]|nr:hypothetical protein SAMN05216436_11756 [bacterium A37T11]
MKKVILLFLCFLITALCSFAQENPGIEMATGLRSSGKIYVVVLVMVIIFVGFIAYLYSLDRKISRLEKEHKN